MQEETGPIVGTSTRCHCGHQVAELRETTISGTAGTFKGKPFDQVERHWLKCTQCGQIRVDFLRTFKGVAVDDSVELTPLGGRADRPTPTADADAGVGVDVLEPEAAGDQAAAMQRLKDAADRIEQRAIDAERAAGETELPTPDAGRPAKRVPGPPNPPRPKRPREGA
jgi:hypothetical protein